MKEISAWKEIPNFKNNEEETVFWSNHYISPKLMAGSMQVQKNKESTMVTLRFDPQLLHRIKRLSRERYLNYQSMIKQWLSERLEEEIMKKGE